jgi:hypothetical protein
MFGRADNWNNARDIPWDRPTKAPQFPRLWKGGLAGGVGVSKVALRVYMGAAGVGAAWKNQG